MPLVLAAHVTPICSGDAAVATSLVGALGAASVLADSTADIAEKFPEVSTASTLK
jgi:hypothetical protein